MPVTSPHHSNARRVSSPLKELPAVLIALLATVGAWGGSSVAQAQAGEDLKAVYNGELTVLSGTQVNLTEDGVRIYPGEKVTVDVTDDQTININERRYTTQDCNEFLGIKFNCKDVHHVDPGWQRIETAFVQVTLERDGRRPEITDEIKTYVAKEVPSLASAESYEASFVTPRRLLGSIQTGGSVSRVACPASTCSSGLYTLKVTVDVTERLDKVEVYLRSSRRFTEAEVIDPNFLNANLRGSRRARERVAVALLAHVDRHYPLSQNSGDETRLALLQQAESFFPENTAVQTALVDLFLENGRYREAELQGEKAMDLVIAKVRAGQATSEEYDFFAGTSRKLGRSALERSEGNSRRDVASAIAHFKAGAEALEKRLDSDPADAGAQVARDTYVDLQFGRADGLARFGTRDALAQAVLSVGRAYNRTPDFIEGTVAGLDVAQRLMLVREPVARALDGGADVFVRTMLLTGGVDAVLPPWSALGTSGAPTGFALRRGRDVTFLDVAGQERSRSRLPGTLEPEYLVPLARGTVVGVDATGGTLHEWDLQAGTEWRLDAGDLKGPAIFAAAPEKNRVVFARHGLDTVSFRDGTDIIDAKLSTGCTVTGLRLSPGGTVALVAFLRNGTPGWARVEWRDKGGGTPDINCGDKKSATEVPYADATFDAAGRALMLDPAKQVAFWAEGAPTTVHDLTAISDKGATFAWAGSGDVVVLRSRAGAEVPPALYVVATAPGGGGTKVTTMLAERQAYDRPERIRVLDLGAPSKTDGVRSLSVIYPDGKTRLRAYRLPDRALGFPVLLARSPLLRLERGAAVNLVPRSDNRGADMVWVEPREAVIHRAVDGATEAERIPVTAHPARAATVITATGRDFWTEVGLSSSDGVVSVTRWNANTGLPGPVNLSALLPTATGTPMWRLLGERSTTLDQHARPSFVWAAALVDGAPGVGGATGVGVWVSDLGSPDGMVAVAFPTGPGVTPVAVLRRAEAGQDVLLGATSGGEVRAYARTGALPGLVAVSGYDAQRHRFVVGSSGAGGRFARLDVGTDGVVKQVALFEVRSATGIQGLLCTWCGALDASFFAQIIARSGLSLDQGVVPVVFTEDFRSAVYATKGELRFGTPDADGQKIPSSIPAHLSGPRVKGATDSMLLSYGSGQTAIHRF